MSSSLAEPTLALFMYIELPRILMSLLSTPLSMRALLSLRSADSVLGFNVHIGVFRFGYSVPV